MNMEDPLEDQLLAIKPRDFKCPCGKTYLSYAALFTHVKQKHDGTPPGKITKPPSQHEKRGRPPVRAKPEHKEPEKAPETDHPPNSNEPQLPAQSQQQRLYREEQADLAVEQLARILLDMPQTELNKSYLNQLEVFAQMSVYLNTRSLPVNYAHGNVCIADGFIEFAQLICSKIEWWKFQALYLLFMLFLQYIIDVEDSKKIMWQLNMDLMCEYLNDFVVDHMKEMSSDYEFESHWLVVRQNAIKVFYTFFAWCTSKRYITYKINLSQA